MTVDTKKDIWDYDFDPDRPAFKHPLPMEQELLKGAKKAAPAKEPPPKD